MIKARTYRENIYIGDVWAGTRREVDHFCGFCHEELGANDWYIKGVGCEGCGISVDYDIAGEECQHCQAYMETAYIQDDEIIGCDGCMTHLPAWEVVGSYD